MTDQEINHLIAEACPTVAGVWSDGELRWDSKLRPVPTCFDPVSDLNAMHEAEKGLHDAQYVQFGLHLNEAWLCDNPQPMRRIGIMRAASATARQRAEAFLRTLGKWRD